MPEQIITFCGVIDDPQKGGQHEAHETIDDDEVDVDYDDDELLLLEPPNEFVCPITHQLMIDPVMSKNGVTYERKAILEWLTTNTNSSSSSSSSSGDINNNNNCPLTRQPLKPSMLVSNSALKIKIHKWKMDNGFSDTASRKPISLRSLYFDYSTTLINSNSSRSITADSRPSNSSAETTTTAAAEEEEEQSVSIVNDNFRSERSSSSPSPSSAAADNENGDDDMNDLLELYNDVLELIDTNISRTVNNNINNRKNNNNNNANIQV